jgi:hypothetical protein
MRFSDKSETTMLDQPLSFIWSNTSPGFIQDWILHWLDNSVALVQMKSQGLLCAQRRKYSRFRTAIAEFIRAAIVMDAVSAVSAKPDIGPYPNREKHKAERYGTQQQHVQGTHERTLHKSYA